LKKKKIWTFPEPLGVTAKKICVWQRSNKDTFPLEITHVRDDECQREAARFKQSVTVHEKPRKAEPLNVHWKREMKLNSIYSLFQTQLLWWFDSSSILPFPVSQFFQ